MDKALIGRVLSGTATNGELDQIGHENVVAIKSDPSNSHRRFSIDKIFGVEPEKRTIKGVTHSTENTDRVGDIIKLSGWQLDAYKSNPVLLFAHNDWKPPVASVTKVRTGRSPSGMKSLLIDEKYHEPEINPEAEVIWRMAATGALPGRSVGFRALEVHRPENDSEREKLGLGKHGVMFSKQELLESSVVPIPANADAIAGKGFTSKCYDLARKTMRQAVDDGVLSDMLARKLADIVPITEEDKARQERARKRSRVVVPDTTELRAAVRAAVARAYDERDPADSVEEAIEAEIESRGFLDASAFVDQGTGVMPFTIGGSSGTTVTMNMDAEQITELRAENTALREQNSELTKAVGSLTRTVEGLREAREPEGRRTSSDSGEGYGAAFDMVERRRTARELLAKQIADRIAGVTKH